MKAMLKALTVAAALIALATPAMAVDFVGYFRDGTALSSKGGPGGTFQTPGMDWKLRLGNENDNYGEWGLEQSIYKDKAGVEAKVGVMFAYYGGASNPGDSKNYNLGIQQNYVSMKFPQFAGAKITAGKFYFLRENIDPIDHFYLNTGSSPGVSVSDIDVGMGKLAVAIFGQGAKDTAGNTNAYVREDARWYGIPAWSGATLTFDLNALTTSRHTDATKPSNESKLGIWATAEWVQSGILGGSNTLVVSYANGTNAGMGPGVGFCGGNTQDDGKGVCSTQSDSEKNSQFAVWEQLLLQPSNVFQIMVGGSYQAKTFGLAGGDKTTSTSYGAFARPIFWVSDYFKLQGGLSYTSVQYKDAKILSPSATKDAMNMTEWTIAPTISPAVGEGGGYFVRPEIRLFVTGAFWNDKANAGPGVAGGNYGTDKSGITYGAQVETWF